MLGILNSRQHKGLCSTLKASSVRDWSHGRWVRLHVGSGVQVSTYHLRLSRKAYGRCSGVHLFGVYEGNPCLWNRQIPDTSLKNSATNNN